MATDFSCQQPRFAIHSPNVKQRSPVSVYMRYDASRNLTYYIISAPETDECVLSFKSLLHLASSTAPGRSLNQALLKHPLEAHVLLTKILCESSQGYINLFRQSMFAQVCRTQRFICSRPLHLSLTTILAPRCRRDFSQREPRSQRSFKRNNRTTNHLQRRQQTHQ